MAPPRTRAHKPAQLNRRPSASTSISTSTSTSISKRTSNTKAQRKVQIKAQTKVQTQTKAQHTNSQPNTHPQAYEQTQTQAQPTSTPLCLNVLSVLLGTRAIKPWYPSLYREELVTGEPVARLAVCERCFRYSREVVLGLAHRRFCEFRDDVPGRVVFTKGRYSIYEVDGEEYQLFTQNLSLFSKLFIENKSVCFDVTTFLYYLLVDNHSSPTASSSPSKIRPSKVGKTKANTTAAATATAASPHRKPQIVGFFSKEKLSWDNNNLACILVFPPWQRLGLGQMLMGASYELAKREGRLGGPERPLSTLGKKSYMTYWSRSVARALLAAPNKSRLSVQQISDATYMSPEDVVATLLEMDGVLGTKYRGKDGEERVRLDKGMVRMWLARHGGDIEAKSAIDLDGFVEDDEEEGQEEASVAG